MMKGICMDDVIEKLSQLGWVCTDTVHLVLSKKDNKSVNKVVLIELRRLCDVQYVVDTIAKTLSDQGE